MHSREVWVTYGSSGGSSGSGGRARGQLLGAVGALVVLATLLPGPARILGTFSARDRATTSIADESMLRAAAIVVWLLLIWVLLAASAALLGRAPGLTGRLARQV